MGALSNMSGRVKEVVAGAAAVDLRRRVGVLEDEVQECRELSRRVAELTDIMTELLLPMAQRDEEKLQELLGRYQDSL